MPPAFDQDRHLIKWFRSFRPSAEPRFDTDAAWRRFERAYMTSDLRRRQRRRRYQAVAALIAAAVVSVAVWWRVSPRQSPSKGGQLQLADGSTVVVHGGTVRTSADQREVVLEGEASFDVRHDSRHPFRVRTSRWVIEDIGTRFDVRSYPGDSAFAVIVREGSVSLSEADKPRVQLRAGEFLSEFEHVSVAAVAKTLERAFAKPIIIADSTLARRLITARLRGNSIDGALAAIAAAVGASYEQDGDSYRLRPGASR